MITNYLGWEVTQLRQGAWKATKNGTSFNTSNSKLLKAMIKEHEGVSNRDDYVSKLAKLENRSCEQSDKIMKRAFERLLKTI